MGKGGDLIKLCLANASGLKLDWHKPVNIMYIKVRNYSPLSWCCWSSVTRAECHVWKCVSLKRTSANRKRNLPSYLIIQVLNYSPRSIIQCLPLPGYVYYCRNLETGLVLTEISQNLRHNANQITTNLPRNYRYLISSAIGKETCEVI